MKKIIAITILLLSSIVSASDVDAISLALPLIKKYEGFSAEVYTCPAGKKTIGYGFTSKTHIQLKKMTEAEASVILSQYVKRIDSKVRKELPDLNPQQRAAVVSFIFNLGEGNFNGSTLKKKLIQQDYPAAAAEFPKWNKIRSKGKLISLKGLSKRRAEEQQLFLK